MIFLRKNLFLITLSAVLILFNLYYRTQSFSNLCSEKYIKFKFIFGPYFVNYKEISISENINYLKCFSKVFLKDEIYIVFKSTKLENYTFFTYFLLILILLKIGNIKKRDFSSCLILINTFLIYIIFNPAINIFFISKVLILIYFLLSSFNEKYLKVLISFYFLLIFFQLIQLNSNNWNSIWYPIFNYAGQVPFYDLETLRKWTIDFTSGINIYSENYILNEYGYFISVYPKQWFYILNFLNIQSNLNFYLLCLTLIIIYFLIVFYFYIKNHESQYLIFLISLPSIFVIERGQSDLIIFILFFLFLILRKENLRNILFLLSVYLKYYTFPIILLIKNNKIYKTFIVYFITFLIFLNDYSQIFYISQKALKMYRYNYGLITSKIFFDDIFFELNYLIFIIFFLLVIIIIKLYFKELILSSIQLKHSLEFKFYLASSLVFVTLFLLTTSYHYKLIFLLFSFPYILLQKPQVIKKTFSIIIIILNYDILINLFGIYGIIINQLAIIIYGAITLNFCVDYFKLTFLNSYIGNKLLKKVR